MGRGDVAAAAEKQEERARTLKNGLEKGFAISVVRALAPPQQAG